MHREFQQHAVQWIRDGGVEIVPRTQIVCFHLKHFQPSYVHPLVY
jgi:hypothetical protein